MQEVLEIFYNEIIPEAEEGRIDCYFIYNIMFSTIIEDKRLTNANKDGLFIPTLIVKNKKEFDNLLVSYMNIATLFYKKEKREEENEHDYIKKVMALLWSNATSEDFINPCYYLRKRIEFMNMNIDAKEYNTSLGKINIDLRKNSISNETPYYLNITIDDNMMPMVHLGVYRNKLYIYGVQNKSEERSKKLNRALYRVNEGLPVDEPTDNIDHPENLRGVTPSTLVSLLLAILCFHNLGIEEVVAPVWLPVRWNAKEIMYDYKAEYLLKRGGDKDALEQELKNSRNKHIEIQRNLTDKFIRTFRRLEYHMSNMKVTALPLVDDEELHMVVDGSLECNNSLLKELYDVISVSNTRK